MIGKFKKEKVKTLSIDKRFTSKSKPACINFDLQEGVNVDLRALNNMRRVSKIDEIMTVREYFRNFSSVLNIGEDDIIEWDLMIGKNALRPYFKKLQEEIHYSKKLITSYYSEGLYKKRLSVYENLEPVQLDGELLDKPKYNHCSVTGRTSIREGFNFLTLSKEKRKRVKHVNKDLVLVEIDLKSCEPTFYLNAIGKEFEGNDVYTDISNNIGIEIKDRAKFKRGVLSVMYGAKDSTSKNILRCSFKDLERIKKYFVIEEFKTFLEESFTQDGLIYNYYGRPVCNNSSLVNYWIQSSAVDYCSLAFGKLIEDNNLLPCFFVHDSMTVAVEENKLDSVLSLTSVKDDYSGIEIPVEVCLNSR